MPTGGLVTPDWATAGAYDSGWLWRLGADAVTSAQPDWVELLSPPSGAAAVLESSPAALHFEEPAGAPC